MAAQSDSRARGSLRWGWQCPSPPRSPPHVQHRGCTSGPPPPVAHMHTQHQDPMSTTLPAQLNEAQ